LKVSIYLEGGGDTSAQKSRCREGFNKLLTKYNFFKGNMPQLIACGGRGNAFKQFKNALHKTDPKTMFITMWIDSEDPVSDIEKTWLHLKNRKGDDWDKPDNATDEHVLFMTTCMETLIVADRKTLESFFGERLQVNALPPLDDLEAKDRHDLLKQLEHATRNCNNAYSKGDVSFTILKELNPEVLEEKLPSFKRALRILKERIEV
jgi:hypothetical protein